MCRLPQLRVGARFCTRGAMQRHDVVLFIIALAKTVTPGGGPRREPGRAVPLTTKRSSLARKFSRYGVAIAYTDLLALVFLNSFKNKFFEVSFECYAYCKIKITIP